MSATLVAVTMFMIVTGIIGYSMGWIDGREHGFNEMKELCENDLEIVDD